MAEVRRKRCCVCNKLTFNWQRINGGAWHCFDGCYSATGIDRRTTDGEPAWLPYKDKPAWDPARLWNNK